nr:hypothetical protein Iba_chr05dCG2150 [Ipomoea batatas]
MGGGFVMVLRVFAAFAPEEAALLLEPVTFELEKQGSKWKGEWNKYIMGKTIMRFRRKVWSRREEEGKKVVVAMVVKRDFWKKEKTHPVPGVRG